MLTSHWPASLSLKELAQSRMIPWSCSERADAVALHNRHKKELADISAALAAAYEETRIEAAASYRLMVGVTGAGMAGGLMHGQGSAIP